MSVAMIIERGLGAPTHKGESGSGTLALLPIKVNPTFRPFILLGSVALREVGSFLLYPIPNENKIHAPRVSKVNSLRYSSSHPPDPLEPSVGDLGVDLLCNPRPLLPLKAV